MLERRGRAAATATGAASSTALHAAIRPPGEQERRRMRQPSRVFGPPDLDPASPWPVVASSSILRGCSTRPLPRRRCSVGEARAAECSPGLFPSYFRFCFSVSTSCLMKIQKG